MLDGFKMVSTDSNSEYVKLENFEMFLTGIGTGYMTYCDQIETIKAFPPEKNRLFLPNY
jgi:hypothetical protein